MAANHDERISRLQCTRPLPLKRTLCHPPTRQPVSASRRGADCRRRRQRALLPHRRTGASCAAQTHGFLNGTRL